MHLRIAGSKILTTSTIPSVIVLTFSISMIAPKHKVAPYLIKNN